MDQLNDNIAAYREQLAIGQIQKAYSGLLKYMMTLKAFLSERHSDKFSFGNVSPGYMDYTYFPFFNDYLRERKLRFGIVLNHEQMRFELWLMGQNVEVQQKYWELLKSTEWNQHRTSKPRYAELEVVLVDKPDFNNLAALSVEIEAAVFPLVERIIKNIP